VVSSTPRPHFAPGKDPVPIVQEAGWAAGSVWTVENLAPTEIRSPDRLSYPASKEDTAVINSRVHSKQPVIVTDVLRGLRQCLQTNVVIAPQIRALHLLSESFLFHKSYSLYHPRFIR
jgi:hypothetical protein